VKACRVPTVGLLVVGLSQNPVLTPAKLMVAAEPACPPLIMVNVVVWLTVGSGVANVILLVADRSATPTLVLPDTVNCGRTARCNWKPPPT